MQTSILTNWKIHFVVILLSIIAELIGIQQIKTGIGVILFLPLLYAFILALFFNENIIPAIGQHLGSHNSATASQWVLIGIMPFIAKFGVGIGPNIDKLIAAGPALLLQEIGNVATALFALPVAVLIFKMGREAIGATHSIAREPNIALVADKFGLKSSEGVGVMGVYVMGTLFGTIFFSIMAALLASWNIFDYRALAMACGVGSGSMMGACSAALSETLPTLKDEIVAFAASSNLLTYATGLFVSAFIALPFTEFFYRILKKIRSSKSSNENQELANLTASNGGEYTEEKEVSFSSIQTIIALAVVSVVALIVNWVSTGVSFIDGLPGMAIFWLCSVLGYIIYQYVKIGVPAVAWISIVAIVFSIPQFPFSQEVITYTSKIGLLPMITPVLAYAGLAISRMEIRLFKAAGFKIAIVALLAFVGTFVGSAIIAQALL